MTYRQAMRCAARVYLQDLVRNSATIKEAAETAGMSRTHFYRLCHAAGVKWPYRYGRHPVDNNTQRLLDQWQL